MLQTALGEEFRNCPPLSTWRAEDYIEKSGWQYDQVVAELKAAPVGEVDITLSSLSKST